MVDLTRAIMREVRRNKQFANPQTSESFGGRGGSYTALTAQELIDHCRTRTVETLLQGFADIPHASWEEAARKALAVAEIIYPDADTEEAEK